MPPIDPRRFPVGAEVTLEQLEQDPYDALAELRKSEPVSWLPALNGWFVTRRDLAIHAMRDTAAFTVDDPRFTTAAVLGPSMLSVEGGEHARHREPFAPSFRATFVRERFESFLAEQAHRLVEEVRPSGHAELRTEIAGPLAVIAIAEFLGLVDVTPREILSWYASISDAILDLTVGDTVSTGSLNAIQELRHRVDATVLGSSGSLLDQIAAEGQLEPQEITSGAAVIMFGAIETSEGMIANALWHLLSHPAQLNRAANDRDLVPAAIEESLRLEPAAASVDRYTTGDVVLSDVTIPAGDLVTISLLAANRDPAMFEAPERFDIDRPNARQHVAFVQGPHGCIGLHLARLETTLALNAVLDGLPALTLDTGRTTSPRGLIFRKPESLVATWEIS